ncbi:OmpA family protein [Kineosporia mesophila]|uniref:OmpA family protein n=1 Tax=Kineosporia mesophila TaxID=566012 RepID=UPI001E61A9AC|nr:OmpA family protein [Kineosporia mesophila]
MAAVAMAMVWTAISLGRSPETTETASGQSGATAECSDPGGSVQGSQESGQTVVLIDRSASAQTSAVYAKAVDPMLRSAVMEGRTVWVAGFDASATVLEADRAVTAVVGNNNNRIHARAEALKCLRHWASAQTAAKAANSDVLGALAWASTTASGVSPKIILSSDGLSNTGCVDLNLLSRAESPATVAARCQATQELPELDGFSVLLVGLGLPAGQSSVVRDGDRQWLIEFWKGLLTAAGARSVEVATDQDKVSFQAERPPSTPTDVDVALPQIARTETGSTSTVSLNDRMLFLTGSSELGPTAEDALGQVLSDLREVDGTVAEVTGHTDSRGTPRSNELLSQARAQSVSAYLKDQGYPATRIRGAGETEPDPECLEKDAPKEELAARQACNRRVEVVITFGQPQGGR